MPQPALLAHDLVRTLGGRRVLDGVRLTASPGHRIGLIGENGVGKSTPLRLLAGVDEPNGGSVSRPRDVGFLQQEMPFDADFTLGAVLDEALREAREDLAELDRLGKELARVPEDDPGHRELLDTYGRRLEQAQNRESWDADRRAALVLDGLGLGALGHDRSLRSLSGGQRGRLALAALLVRRPFGPPRCSWTSRPTTSTTTPPLSSRHRSGPCPAPWWSPATTGRSSTPSAPT